MTPAIAIAKLAAMGLPAEKLEEAAAIIEAVVAAAIEETEVSRLKPGAVRTRRWRDRKLASPTVTDRHQPSPIVTNVSRRDDDVVVIDSITTTINSDISILQQQENASPTVTDVTPKVRASRGTRLPEDFVPHPNILELARSLGFTDAEYWDHFERFKDYWRSLSGAKAMKLDWNATWRNRVKDLADKLKRGFNGKNTSSSISTRFDAIRASIAGRGHESDQDRGEDSVGLPGLRQSA